MRILLLPVLFFLSVSATSGQNVIRGVAPGASSGVIVQANPTVVPNGIDPFDSLVSSAASFDMESPVEVKTEFDPPVIAVGGRAIYRIVLNALDESVKVPNVLPGTEGLEVRKGGRGQTYQNVGGLKLRPQTTILFHVTATNAGTITIPSFELMAYGKQVKVPEARLDVLQNKTGAMREPPRLQVNLPTDEVYVGQSLRIPLILPDSGDGSIHGLSQAKIKGEFIFSESFSFGTRQEAVRRNGRMVPAFVQEVVVTPLSEGEQTVLAQAHSISTRMVQTQTNALQTVNTLVDSDPIKLKVKPLPEQGKRPGFMGAVGSFNLEPAKLSTNIIHVGEPLTMTLVIHGDGNIGRLKFPEVPTSKEWQTLPPITDTSLPASIIQQRGFTSFSYTMIPLTDKVKATPEIPFSYFDPRKQSYVDLTIPATSISVKPSPLASQTVEAMNLSERSSDSPPKEKPLVMMGIVEQEGRGVGRLEPLQTKWWFLGLQVLPAAGIGGLWAWDRRRRYLQEHPEIVLKRRARRGLRRQLREMRRAAENSDSRKFVIAGVDAMREACAPHVPAEPQALVCVDVVEVLASSNLGVEDRELALKFFRAADDLQFSTSAGEAADLLRSKPMLERLLEQLGARL